MKILDKIAKCLGYVSEDSIPVVGATMKAEGCSPVEVLDVQPYWVTYKLPNGQTMTRSRRGFMKYYRKQ